MHLPSRVGLKNVHEKYKDSTKETSLTKPFKISFQKCIVQV